MERSEATMHVAWDQRSYWNSSQKIHNIFIYQVQTISDYVPYLLFSTYYFLTSSIFSKVEPHMLHNWSHDISSNWGHLWEWKVALIIKTGLWHKPGLSQASQDM